MKKTEIDKRIKVLQEEIRMLKEAKYVDDDISTLYGEISSIIEKHLHANDPRNIATRTTIFKPIMNEIRQVFKEHTAEIINAAQMNNGSAWVMLEKLERLCI